MAPSDEVIDQFETAARAVCAVVGKVADVAESIDYTVSLCVRKEACELLASGCEQPLSDRAGQLCGMKQQKVVAAPNLPADQWNTLRHACEQHGVFLTDRPLRDHLSGIDIGLTLADYGIAETGTLVIDSRDEDVRLAGMISEIHVAVLPISRIRAAADQLSSELHGMMAGTPAYLAFITGASRTADIERVLTIGVHGPLELHILLLEER